MRLMSQAELLGREAQRWKTTTLSDQAATPARRHLTHQTAIHRRRRGGQLALNDRDFAPERGTGDSVTVLVPTGDEDDEIASSETASRQSSG
jgi:hypothetical protein